MKKIFLLTLAISMSICSYAQFWTVTTEKADELKGIKETFSIYAYVDEEFNICAIWSNSNELRVITNKGIFDYGNSLIYGSYSRNLKATYGIYDLSDKLLKKGSITFYIPKGSSNMAVSSDRRTAKELVKCIKTQRGCYVRLLLPRYGEPEVDIKVPYLNLDEEMVDFDNLMKSKKETEEPKDSTTTEQTL